MLARTIVCLALAAATFACGAPATTEVVFRDPWQVALVRVARSGARSRVLAPREREHGWAYRDDRGFPHYQILGDFGWHDGTLVVDEAPIVDGRDLTLRAEVYGYGWCRRPVRRCRSSRGWLEIVSPRANVLEVRRVAGRDEPIELP